MSSRALDPHSRLPLAALARPDWILLDSVCENQDVVDLAYGCVVLERQLLIRHCAKLTDHTVLQTNVVSMQPDFDLIVVVAPVTSRPISGLAEMIEVLTPAEFQSLTHSCLNYTRAAN